MSRLVTEHYDRRGHPIPLNAPCPFTTFDGASNEKLSIFV